MIRVLVGKIASKKISISPEELFALATTPALFGAQTFTFAEAFTGERGEEFLGLVDTLKKSPHTFIFEEEKLLKKETEALTKAGVKIENTKRDTKEYTFDQFGITSALQARDKKKLWLGLMTAFRAGEKPEAVAGLLTWKARQMGDGALSRELTYMYHDSHRGMGDLELLLERFVLKL
jgi:hypothetical protein